MTASLAPADPYTTSFASRVTGVDGAAVRLAETHFYPEGGGQPADRGTLGGVPVAHVRQADGGVVHELESAPSFEAGDEVQGEIDPEFRRYCMRAHTASHVLYGAGRRVLDDLGYGGFDISPEKVRVDFETSTEITDGVLVELERLTNRAVWDSHDVTWGEVPTEEAHERDDSAEPRRSRDGEAVSRDDEGSRGEFSNHSANNPSGRHPRGNVAFNTKTEEGVMSDADAVRVVEVGGWDAAACGGTHVRDTSEIGPVEVLARSNPGEGLTRVEFAVGASAVERRAGVRRATLAASQELGVPEDELADAARRLREDNDALEAELADVTMDAVRARLADFDTHERDGEWWRVGTVSGFDANDVGDAAKDIVGENEDAPDVVAVAGGDDRAFVVVTATGDATDPPAVVDAVTDEFGGGGGGGRTFAQGGGIDATPQDVARFVRER